MRAYELKGHDAGAKSVQEKKQVHELSQPQPSVSQVQGHSLPIHKLKTTENGGFGPYHVDSQARHLRMQTHAIPADS